MIFVPTKPEKWCGVLLDTTPGRRKICWYMERRAGLLFLNWSVLA